jgi:hypothetical protein
VPHKIIQVPPLGGPAHVLSRNQAADLLQLSARTVDLLLRSKYLPDLGTPRILALSRAPYVEAVDADQPVIRQPLAELDEHRPLERKYVGDAAWLTDDEAVDAGRMWWRIDPKAVRAAGLLPVQMGTFITTVLQVPHEAEVLSETQLLPADPAKGRSKDVTHVRYAFTAMLAGRVRALGEPDRDYIAPALDSEVESTVRTLLGARSRARSGGPVAYLPRHGE